MDNSKQKPSVSQPKKKLHLDAAAEIAPILNGWTPQEGDLAALAPATQRSLEAVIHLTEYEDAKANRILTAMAFMSAFVAVMFAVVPARYPLHIPLILNRRGFPWEAYLVLAMYGFFIIYVLTLTIGVAFILHGMRPRFNVPKAWKPDTSKPASYLFFEKIAEVTPAVWAKAFTTSPAHQVVAEQVKNSILETYLIAEKIGLKVKWLGRGVKLLFVSTIVLAVLLPLVVATIALVPPSAEKWHYPPQKQAIHASGTSTDSQRLLNKPDLGQNPSAPTKARQAGKAQ